MGIGELEPRVQGVCAGGGVWHERRGLHLYGVHGQVQCLPRTILHLSPQVKQDKK